MLQNVFQCVLRRCCLLLAVCVGVFVGVAVYIAVYIAVCVAVCVAVYIMYIKRAMLLYFAWCLRYAAQSQTNMHLQSNWRQYL